MTTVTTTVLGSNVDTLNKNADTIIELIARARIQLTIILGVERVRSITSQEHLTPVVSQTGLNWTLLIEGYDVCTITKAGHNKLWVITRPCVVVAAIIERDSIVDDTTEAGVAKHVLDRQLHTFILEFVIIIEWN